MMIVLGGGASCIAPLEARLAKVGTYSVEMDFTKETLRDQNDARYIGDTKGRVVGMLLIRERAGDPGSAPGLPVDAEFVMVSCSGLSGEYCNYSTRFKSDPIWGGLIDAPTADDASLQLLLAGDSDLYIELDGTFKDGKFKGAVLMRKKGICCGTGTAEYTTGTFQAAR
jgi:hypothetical protein